MDKYLDGLRSMRLYRQANTLPTTSGTLQLTLGNVASYTMELDVDDKRGFSSFTLRGVPLFLVEAFNFLRVNGLYANGIFRKEGNLSRLRTFSMQTFFGSKMLPEDSTTHDVCSLIKRFFRELKIPLFAQVQAQLLEAAIIYDETQRVDKILETVRKLPPEHLATLAFLMRQLKYFGDRHEGHQMTIENIACVFAPSLFRDEPPSASNKRKRGVQDDLIVNVRNETELRISIIVDLIKNASKIGVPRDYYLASRRPSEVSQKLLKGRFMGNSGMRSVSAKPVSRNVSSAVLMNQKAEFQNDKQPSIKFVERHKDRIHERRSSSTVREFFSNISNKVLRRGISPSVAGRRRCSAGDITDEEIARENMTHTDVITPKFCVHNHADVCDNGQHTPCLTFKNESRPGISSADISNRKASCSCSATEKSSEVDSQTILPEVNICVFPTKSDDMTSASAASSKHRSRRESPRKSTTTNSRIRANEKKKFIKEIKEANIIPASPAFEPVEMSTKHIDEAFLKHKDSCEKSLLMIKKSSSKKLLQSVKIADSANPFMEDYSTNKAVDRSRRRHTAPVKANTLLKRNQPNTITTGLKTPHSRVQDRRSATLSLRPNGADGNFLENKKRHSENLGGELSDSISSSDYENDALEAQTLIAHTLLEQKCIESRQRRIKRQKRREVTNASAQEIHAHNSVSGPKPVISLFDDVTNEINRIERDRKLEEYSQEAEKNNSKSFSNFVGKDRDLEIVSVKGDPPLCPIILLPTETPEQTSDSVHSVMRKSSTKLSTCADVDIQNKAFYQSLPVCSSFHSTTLAVKSSSSVVDTTHNHETHVKQLKHVSVEKSVGDVRYPNCNVSESDTKKLNHPGVFDEYFSKSDAIKKQLLSARNEDDIVSGPAYVAQGLRPSVLLINTNNRGMVKQRVNLFAQLETQATVVEKQNVKTGHHSQDDEHSTWSFQKPTAPPASHGLRVKTVKNVSPFSPKKVSMEARKFEGTDEVNEEQQVSSFKLPQQHRNVGHSLSISSSITARSPTVFVSATKPRRPPNPFKNNDAERGVIAATATSSTVRGKSSLSKH